MQPFSCTPYAATDCRAEHQTCSIQAPGCLRDTAGPQVPTKQLASKLAPKSKRRKRSKTRLGHSAPSSSPASELAGRSEDTAIACCLAVTEGPAKKHPRWELFLMHCGWLELDSPGRHDWGGCLAQSTLQSLFKHRAQWHRPAPRCCVAIRGHLLSPGARLVASQTLSSCSEHRRSRSACFAGDCALTVQVRAWNRGASCSAVLGPDQHLTAARSAGTRREPHPRCLVLCGSRDTALLAPSRDPTVAIPQTPCEGEPSSVMAHLWMLHLTPKAIPNSVQARVLAFTTPALISLCESVSCRWID